MGEHPAIQSVTLETIDQSINDWFDRTVDAHVVHPNQERRKVTVKFGGGERWVTARERRGIRDTNGVLILPVISVRRTNIEPDPSMTALGTETPVLQVARRVSQKTNDLMNLNAARDPALRVPRPVVYEVTTIPFPDRSILTYEVQVQAQYLVQMNAILEKMLHQLDIHKSFVAPFQNDGRQPLTGVPFEQRKPIDRSYVVGFFDSGASDTGNLEEFTDQERIIRYSTQVRVPAVLQLDPEGTKPAVQVERTAFGLNFSDERVCFVDDPAELEKIFGPR